MSVLGVAIAGLLVAGPPVASVQELSKLLQEEFDLLQAIDQLDDDRAEQARLLVKNQAEKAEVERALARAKARYNQAEDTLTKAREKIRKRIRVYLELKRLDKVVAWKLFVATGGYDRFVRKRRAMEELARDSEARIRKYHDKVKDERAALLARQHQIEQLEAVEKRIVDAKTRLEQDKLIKEALLHSVNHEKAYYAKADKDLSVAAKELQEKIDTYKEWRTKYRYFRQMRGQFPKPLPGGKLVMGFGPHKHPEFKTTTIRHGLDFVPGKKGKKVVYPFFTGKVVFAGWLRGFGNTVILSHSQSDYTLYAHLAKIKVKKGDWLSTKKGKNRPLGILGKSGSLRGERLYFELRIEGKPVNPVPWFR